MLEVNGLSVAYGQHPALNDAHLRVSPGEIVVILGANGAGKSTMLKAISGICEGKVSGSVLLDGTELVGLRPHRIVEAGVALVPEGRGVFGDLTVQENLTLGAYSDRAREEEEGNLDRVLSLFPKLTERRRQQVRTMSGGEQQMVAIGRAMMSNPQLLTLDEPSLGLSPLLTKELFQNLAAVRETGIGILLVEQNARASLAIADRGYLLENTRIVHEGSAEALRSDPAVQKAYLGGGGTAKGAVTGRPAAKTPGPGQVRVGTTGLAAPKPTKPRPAAQAPSDIAAAAMAGFAKRREDRPADAVSPPVAPEPKPKAAPVAQPAPRPTAVPRSEADRLLGRSVSDLVERAARTSRAGIGTSRPRSEAGAAASSEPPATSMPPMPALDTESADRLKTVLAEIEEAAARARAWRPENARK